MTKTKLTNYRKAPRKRRKATTKPNGYILFEDALRVIIATGFSRKSKNIKTGDMIQVWILVKDQDPVDAVNSGRDELICGNCPLRGTTTEAQHIDNAGLTIIVDKVTGKRSCYVNTGQAPLMVWKAWRRGKYPKLPSLDLFIEKRVRFGAYGDPIFLPFYLAKQIADVAFGFTGYSHQWRNPLFSAWKNLIMASVETVAGAEEAESKGWRTFRVLAKGEKNRQNEVGCLNETRGIQCSQCLLCGGKSRKAKSITIRIHGSLKKNFRNN